MVITDPSFKPDVFTITFTTFPLKSLHLAVYKYSKTNERGRAYLAIVMILTTCHNILLFAAIFLYLWTYPVWHLYNIRHFFCTPRFLILWCNIILFDTASCKACCDSCYSGCTTILLLSQKLSCFKCVTGPKSCKVVSTTITSQPLILLDNWGRSAYIASTDNISILQPNPLVWDSLQACTNYY